MTPDERRAHTASLPRCAECRRDIARRGSEHCGRCERELEREAARRTLAACHTVEELIAILREFPPDAPVVLRDPDTEWALWLRVAQRGGTVEVTGDYGDRVEE